ncbi:MAG: ArgR family transcriptional regulator [Bryobacterales bacterium]|nr:ArgR family transcriptional regulator [Bryobacterales bacterium]
MNTSFRQSQILRVIRQRPVHTQEELARELAKLGIQATQVTLSRDIKKLGLAKTANGYVQLDTMPDPETREAALASTAGELLQEVRVAQFMVVLKTPPGKANALAVELDDEGWDEIVGTVAGDDTILIVTPDNTAAQRLSKKLLSYVT